MFVNNANIFWVSFHHFINCRVTFRAVWALKVRVFNDSYFCIFRAKDNPAVFNSWFQWIREFFVAFFAFVSNCFFLSFTLSVLSCFVNNFNELLRIFFRSPRNVLGSFSTASLSCLETACNSLGKCQHKRVRTLIFLQRCSMDFEKF